MKGAVHGFVDAMSRSDWDRKRGVYRDRLLPSLYRSVGMMEGTVEDHMPLTAARTYLESFIDVVDEFVNTIEYVQRLEAAVESLTIALDVSLGKRRP